MILKTVLIGGNGGLQIQHGLALPTGGECGDPAFLMELGVLAEEAGWDGVFLEDYICFQGDPEAPTCDPWVALAAMAVPY